MYIARILYPVKVLGPGKRIGIWFSGCPHHCKGCSNPELWEQRPEQEISKERLLDLIHSISSTHSIDGFTITGGEPFAQPKALAELIIDVNAISNDILIYTGYTRAELKALKDIYVSDILNRIAVLIDGRYKEELNHGVFLRGSDNQVIHRLNPQWDMRYDDYIKGAKNLVQNFTVGDSIISVGIHSPGFSEMLDYKAIEKGILS